MKILNLLGSPRVKGNSTTISQWFCDAAAKKGAEINTHVLNKLSYRGCQACMTCKTKLDHCVLKDDLTPILEAVYDADILLMATPVYYGDVSSQLKGFIDRTFSYMVPDYTTNPKPCRLPAGKKLVWIQTQGGDESQFADIFPRYEFFFKWYGFQDNALIRACNVLDKGAIESREDIRKQAEAAAERILF